MSFFLTSETPAPSVMKAALPNARSTTSVTPVRSSTAPSGAAQVKVTVPVYTALFTFLGPTITVSNGSPAATAAACRSTS